MKVTCLLLCLVLPQIIVGNSLNNFPTRKFVQPLDFIDQFEINYDRSDSKSNELKPNQSHLSYIHNEKKSLNQDSKERAHSQEYKQHSTSQESRQQDSNEQYPERHILDKQLADLPRSDEAHQSYYMQPMKMPEQERQELYKKVRKAPTQANRKTSSEPQFFVSAEDQIRYSKKQESRVSFDDESDREQKYQPKKTYESSSHSSEYQTRKQNTKPSKDNEFEEYSMYPHNKQYTMKSGSPSYEERYRSVSPEKTQYKVNKKSRQYYEDTDTKPYPTTRFNSKYSENNKNRYTRSKKEDSSSEEYQKPLTDHQDSQEQLDQQRQSISSFYKQYASLYRPMYTFRKNIMIPVLGKAIVYKDVQSQPIPVKLSMIKNNYESIQNEAYASMMPVSEEAKLQFHQAYESAKDNPNMDRNSTELLRSNGYSAERHIVKTDDGYLLQMMRIPPQKHTRDVQKRPVVLLMHGLFGSSDDWLLNGPKKSLAYILSDAGYDVYLGNERGNKYSRRHVAKKPSQPDFWQFNNDDVALHDLPAMIDYALHTSEQSKLHIVGFSQANAQVLALAATTPEYQDKIISLQAMSPVVYMNHATSPLVKLIAPGSPYYENLKVNEDGEFRTTKDWMRVAGSEMCQKIIGCKHVCSNANFIMSGMNIEQLTGEKAAVIVNHLTSGASTRQMKQVGQAAVAEYFRMYDYGKDMNEKVYDASEPPKYDLSTVKIPVALYSAQQDWLATPEDVERLRRELPNIVTNHKVTEKQFSNMDFLFGKDANSMVYEILVQTMQQNSTNE